MAYYIILYYKPAASARTPSPGASARRRSLGCGQMGSTLMGPLQKYVFVDRLGKKVRPGTFGKIKAG